MSSQSDSEDELPSDGGCSKEKLNLVKKCKKFWEHLKAQHRLSAVVDEKIKLFKEKNKGSKFSRFDRVYNWIRYYVSIVLINQFWKQLVTTGHNLQSEDTKRRLLPFLEWALWIPLFVMQMHSICKAKPNKIVLYCIPILLQVSMVLPFLDFERVRDAWTAQDLTFNYNAYMFRVFVGQVLINLCLNKYVSYTSTPFSIFAMVYGLLRWTNKEESMVEILAANLDSSIYASVSFVLSFAFTNYAFFTYVNDYVTIIYETFILQEETSRVMKNLDEAIICKGSQGISFCNNVGFGILQNIQKILMQNDEYENSKEISGGPIPNTLAVDNLIASKVLPESLLENKFLLSSLQKKKKSQLLVEMGILQAKIFELKSDMNIPNDKDAKDTSDPSVGNSDQRMIGKKKLL